MIRRATINDVPHVVECGRAFHAYGTWSHVPLDEDAFGAFAHNVIAGAGAIFVTDDGMCGGVLVPAYFNPSFVMAAELFWWAPSEGRALREAYEAWAKSEGAAAVQFSAMTDEHLPGVSRLYRMGGFRQAEVAFVKEFR
ncbi:MAG TPA: hypothetical protein VIO94_15975 [Phenylobacterium sp.]